ncbi:MAG: hypothetical protein Q7R90_00760 [bacterium]|nr:hypothetical protein [bacterium]
MAKIDISKLVRSLERELKSVLHETLQELVPDAKLDKEKLFRSFKERIDRHFRRPQDVPDEFVQVEIKS